MMANLNNPPPQGGRRNLQCCADPLEKFVILSKASAQRCKFWRETLATLLKEGGKLSQSSQDPCCLLRILAAHRGSLLLIEDPSCLEWILAAYRGSLLCVKPSCKTVM